MRTSAGALFAAPALAALLLSGCSGPSGSGSPAGREEALARRTERLEGEVAALRSEVAALRAEVDNATRRGNGGPAGAQAGAVRKRHVADSPHADLRAGLRRAYGRSRRELSRLGRELSHALTRRSAPAEKNAGR